MEKYFKILFISILFIPFVIYSQNLNLSWKTRSDSLIKLNKLDEACNYLNSIKSKYQNDKDFNKKIDSVSYLCDSLYDSDITNFTDLLKSNPADKILVRKLAERYKSRNYLDNAIEVLSEYLRSIPEETDEDLRFLLSEYCFLNYDWSPAFIQLDKLLSRAPDNQSYQLLKAKLCIRTSSNLSTAENYLLNLSAEDPADKEVIRELISLYTLENKIEAVEKYYSVLQKISKDQDEFPNYKADQKILPAITANLEESKNVIEKEYKDSTILAKVKYYCSAGDTSRALSEIKKAAERNSGKTEDKIDLAEAYQELNLLDKSEMIYSRLRESESNSDIADLIYKKSLMLSDKFIKSKKYESAGTILKDIELSSNNDLVNRNYQGAMINLVEALIKDDQFTQAEKWLRHLDNLNLDVSLRDELFTKKIELGDSYIQKKKLKESEEIYSELYKLGGDEKKRNELEQRELFLGDLYAQGEAYSTAESLYNKLVRNSKDTAIVRNAQERIDWLPTNGAKRGTSLLSNVLNVFVPSKFIFNPVSSFYHDNQRLDILSYGINASADYFGFLLLGGSLVHTNMKSTFDEKYFDRYDFNAGIRFSKFIAVRGMYSIIKSYDEQEIYPKRIILDLNLYDDFTFSAFYERSDARLLLYSPFLLRTKLNTDHLNWSAVYHYQDQIFISANYNFYKIQDGNKGNEIEIKFGKKFFKSGYIGYEYYFADYLYFSLRYFTPENFDTHSLWTEWYWGNENISYKVGGKLGYNPTDDFTVFVLYGEMRYLLIDHLFILPKISYYSGIRINSDYKNFVANLTLQWGLL